MKTLLFGKVLGGRIIPENRKKLDEAMKNLEGKEIEFSVSPRQRRRSIQYNKYYWEVCVKLKMKETGCSADEVHEYFKREYLSKVIRVHDNQLVIITSTAKLTNKEFTEFIEILRESEINNYGFFIPEPNQYEY